MRPLIPRLILCAALAFPALLSVPAITSHIDDPNAIVYFNNDEGYLMDLVWHYYSGEKRASYQADFDYGLQLLYLSDAAKLFLPAHIRLSPGSFVLFLRWLHLCAWIACIALLYRIMAKQFNSEAAAAAAAALLAVRPAFAYFSMNLKPEPLVLLFTLLGLFFCLRILHEKPLPNMLLSCAFASLAFLTKYAGALLLPAIVCALYLRQRTDRSTPRLRVSTLLPSLFGLALVGIILFLVTGYVRKSTGTTWAQEYGIGHCLFAERAFSLPFALAILLILVPLIAALLKRIRHPPIERLVKEGERLEAAALPVCAAFAAFSTIFGIRWLFNPRHFVTTYAFLGSSATSSRHLSALTGNASIAVEFLKNALEQIVALDPFLCLGLLAYAYAEYRTVCRLNAAADRFAAHQRLVLVVFLLPGLALAFSMLRMAQHHLLAYTAVMIVLTLQAIPLLAGFLRPPKLRTALAVLLCAGIILDLSINGSIVIAQRRRYLLQSHDVAFRVKDWFLRTIPRNARIVADHPTRVYVPDGYTAIRHFIGYQDDRVEQLRSLVELVKPEFIYYNRGPSGGEPIPALERILPEAPYRLIKLFKDDTGPFQRREGDEFALYQRTVKQ